MKLNYFIAITVDFLNFIYFEINSIYLQYNIMHRLKIKPTYCDRDEVCTNKRNTYTILER